MSIFTQEEILISQDFLAKFKSEVEIIEKLLNVHASFIQATSGITKDNEYPGWTILLLLSQTVPLMNNASDLLIKGYLRSSEIFIRVVSEAVILSAYFCEWPEHEITYRTVNYRDFFRVHKIDDMLKKIEKEGKVFISNKQEAKQVKWHQVIFDNLFKESSKFLHNNPNVIFDLSKRQVQVLQANDMIIGPQPYSDDINRMAVRRVLNSILFSIVVLGVSLKIVPDEDEKNIMQEAQRIIEELNDHPKENK